MNELEDLQEIIKNFICEKAKINKEISVIEEKRVQLADQRNAKKTTLDNANAENAVAEINMIGNEISQLGNQSQDLQNKLDSKFIELKNQINMQINNQITERLREISKIREFICELSERISKYENKKNKYKVQQEEFYAKFGKIPELSENAQNINREQELECATNRETKKEFENKIANIQNEITELTVFKKEFRNCNWSKIIENKEESEEVVEIEENKEINLDEHVENFINIVQNVINENNYKIETEKVEAVLEGLETEKAELIEETDLEGFGPIQLQEIEEINIEEESREVEYIVPQETKNVEEIKEIEEIEIEQVQATEDIKLENEQREEIIVPEEKEEPEIHNEKPELLSIIVKFEDGELVYKGQVNDGQEIKLYPTKDKRNNTLLRNRENKKQVKSSLINYAISKYKNLDKKVIKKIDTTICEMITKFAKMYDCDASGLIYNYAMSFSVSEAVEIENMPQITYNLVFSKDVKLTVKEKETIKKICKDAEKNECIEIIETATGIKKLKYIFKRVFNLNKTKALPESRY